MRNHKPGSRSHGKHPRKGQSNTQAQNKGSPTQVTPQENDASGQSSNDPCEPHEAAGKAEGRRWENVISLLTAVPKVLATIVIAIATVTYCSISDGQLTVIRQQLVEMQQTSAIQKAELAAQMDLKLIPNETPSGWGETATWTNVGKTNATIISGWKDFEILRDDQPAGLARQMQQFDFNKPRNRIDIRAASTVIPNQAFTFTTDEIPRQTAQDTKAMKAVPILWGWLQYNDIFGITYSVSYCVHLHFSESAHGLDIDSPHMAREDCNKREQSQPTKKN